MSTGGLIQISCMVYGMIWIAEDHKIKYFQDKMGAVYVTCTFAEKQLHISKASELHNYAPFLC